MRLSIFPYKIMIATNYEVSYFSKFDRISAYSFQNKSIATTRWVARQGLSHGLPNPIKAGLGFKLVFATIASDIHCLQFVAIV